MKHIAAYMLLKLGGKSATADEVTAVITAAGGEADADAVAKLVADLDGKNVDELLASGMEAMKDIKMGGGGGGGGAAAGGEAAAAVEEEKPEEEEMDMGGAMDMFGGEEGTGDY
ncbi:hypothetical protein TrRE_jg6415 [Triparma retinervis]|uniref:60S acidic ribosomal protein P2 n=1 Tax=Triparma retinervis TaxID=2557542 RepID=A0A9W7CLB1_9STRA|nr:hypothetical protein TrRE_jg6415 [Triparma retinervis]